MLFPEAVFVEVDRRHRGDHLLARIQARVEECAGEATYESGSGSTTLVFARTASEADAGADPAKAPRTG